MEDEIERGRGLLEEALLKQMSLKQVLSNLYGQ